MIVVTCTCNICRRKLDNGRVDPSKQVHFCETCEPHAEDFIRGLIEQVAKATESYRARFHQTHVQAGQRQIHEVPR